MTIIVKSRVCVLTALSLGFFFCHIKKGMVSMANNNNELLSSLESLKSSLAMYGIKNVPQLDRYIEQVSTRADDKHVDEYNELVSVYRNSQSKQSVITNGQALVDYVKAHPDLKQLPRVERDMERVQASVDFNTKLGQYVKEYNSSVTIDDARAVLTRIEQLCSQYNVSIDFIANAKKELDAYIDTRVVKQFNDYVDQFNSTIVADRRIALAHEIQAFLNTNPKLKETDSGKSLDHTTSEYLEFIQQVNNNIRSIESLLNE